MGASGNLGVVSAELPLKTLSESVSLPALQVPSLQYAHSFAWAMAAAQAAAANQAYTFNNKEKTLDASHTNLVSQHQAAAFPSIKEASGLRVIEQKLSNAFNSVCSPASMGRSQKETGSSTNACTESCTPQSEVAPCDPSLTAAVADPGSTDDLPKESACDISAQASCLKSQPPLLMTCINKAGFDTMPSIAVAYESFMNPHIAQGGRCGYTYDGSRSGYFFNGHSQTNAFRGRNYFAAVAAAEARRKRKELTRHKFSRSRALRLAFIADNTKAL